MTRFDTFDRKNPGCSWCKFIREDRVGSSVADTVQEYQTPCPYADVDTSNLARDGAVLMCSGSDCRLRKIRRRIEDFLRKNIQEVERTADFLGVEKGI